MNAPKVNLCYKMFRRAPVFSEEIFGGGEGVEGEVVPPQERSFWAKYVSFPGVNCRQFSFS